MMNKGQSWILYHDWHSICSIMARYVYAIRGEPRADSAELQMTEQVCSLRAGEQLTEHFLCDINNNGEVPVLVPANGEQEAISDSVDITWLFADYFPGLLPKEHEGEIKRLVTELHAKVNFFSLTFEGKPEVQQRNMAALRSRLYDDISDEYRKVLEHKIQR
jgi:glutathione S-transferase